MISGTKKAYFDSLRSIAAAGISAAYAAIGTPSTHPIRGICITNNTQGDMILSLDNTDAAGQLFVAKGSYKLWDIQANMNAQFDDCYMLPVGTQVYVKQNTAPVSGDVWVEYLC